MPSQIHKQDCKRRLEQQGSKTVEEMESYESNPKLLRSSIPVFDFMHLCFLCIKKLRRQDGCLGLEVNAYWAHLHHLPAVDAVYHTKCNREFLNGRQCSKVREWYSKTGLGPGHPEHLKKADVFLQCVSGLKTQKMVSTLWVNCNNIYKRHFRSGRQYVPYKVDKIQNYREIWQRTCDL